MTVGRRKFAALLLALCVGVGLGHAARAQADRPAASKLDDFGDIQASDLAARLDNLAVKLGEQPHAKGFVIAYRSRRDLPGLSGRLVSLMRNYLIETRGIAAERVVGVDGGVASCIVQELWIVPPGAAPTPRSDAYQRELDDVDSTRKYDEAALGPAQDSYHNTVEDSLEGYADALRKSPRASAHIIAYAGYYVSRWQEEDARGRKRTRRSVQLDPPGTAAHGLRFLRSRLIRNYGIAPSRIRLVDGGHRKFATAELWIVPRGEHAPVATPNAFPKGRR